MKKYVLFLIVLTLAFLACGPDSEVTVDLLSQDERPDGFVSDWSSITPIDPPPPAPFRLLKGDPINLNWVNRPGTGRENAVEVQFVISMGTVGYMDFNAGSAPGITAATSNIEMALNTWHFTNNGWGPVTMKLNFGSKQVMLDFSKFNLYDKVGLQKTSFYTSFSGRKGDIEFKK